MAHQKMRRVDRKKSDAVEKRPEAPDVIVEFLFDQGRLFVVVRNIGSTPALNISVKFDQKIIGLGGTKEITALPLFKGIPFLGPGREVLAFMDASDSYFTRKQPTKITARVSYTDREKRKYQATIDHDLEIYRELAYPVSASTEHGDPACSI